MNYGKRKNPACAGTEPGGNRPGDSGSTAIRGRRRPGKIRRTDKRPFGKLYRSEEVRKQADKEQKKKIDEAAKNAKRALKHKDIAEMNCAAEALEELIGTQDSTGNTMH